MDAERRYHAWTRPSRGLSIRPLLRQPLQRREDKTSRRDTGRQAAVVAQVREDTQGHSTSAQVSSCKTAAKAMQVRLLPGPPTPVLNSVSSVPEGSALSGRPGVTPNLTPTDVAYDRAPWFKARLRRTDERSVLPCDRLPILAPGAP
jgi:hypothetical protein